MGYGNENNEMGKHVFKEKADAISVFSISYLHVRQQKRI